ncbi:MBOAT family O-acyltransferase [Urechidicola croceus]|uniref:Alginate O-acetyltransferase n=1 Tax=Urechidicola croceus TaxID=1850246 RepID=A0A1D8PAV2_9FLAO|nr:MBOAT family O-acyltransferase [Urechidicola croceus]AOW21718.1 alginate O-acetyltransferase [Urechidicola croceus]
MLFNSFDFLFFFPIVVIIYYLLTHKYRIIWLLIASYFFYFYWEPSLVLLLFTSTLIDYYCGIKIHESEKEKLRKRYLYLSIFINLGLLFSFKYLGFFTETMQQVLQFFGIEISTVNKMQSYSIKEILLPIGISFYTFQTLSYSIDIYRKKINPEKNFIKYALYVSFFPQLVAGPIERADRLLPQFYKKININTEYIKRGIIMMAWGFFLKLVVADRIGVYVDTVFNSPSSFKGLPLLIGSYFFTFQIYFDFSAYTTIAIGAAKVMGFDLMQNFNRPIFAKSMAEVWQRWHISLIKWLRDYLYKPLSETKLGRHWKVLIVFFIIGLWHGADWTFVIWGLINGLFLVLEVATNKFRRRFIKKMKPYINPLIFQFAWWLIIFHFVVFSLIFFRAQSLNEALEYVYNIGKIENLRINILRDYFELFLSFLLILFVQIIHYFKGNDKIYELVTKRPIIIRWGIYLMFIIVIVLFSINRQNNFIYFQF